MAIALDALAKKREDAARNRPSESLGFGMVYGSESQRMDEEVRHDGLELLGNTARKTVAIWNNLYSSEQRAAEYVAP